MKKFLCMLFATFVAMSTLAAPVDQAMAMKTAKNYLANEMYAGKLMAPAALNPVLVKTEMGKTKLNQPVYYIFNTTTTYVVVAGDDRAVEILMVGDAPLDIDNIPPGMQDMLNYYQERIEFLQEHPYLRVQKREPNTSLRAETYGPLLKSKWDQSAPYWKYCNFTYNGTAYQCYTGCPATSAAQVMYYWKYPASVGAMSSYTSTLDLSQNQSVNYTYPALEATTFEWGNMKNYYGYYYNDNGGTSYSSYTTAQGNAVATLMRYVGQAEKMMYGTASAGGNGIYTSDNDVIVTMFKNWGYKSTVRLVSKSSNTTWSNTLKNEVVASRPIVFTAVASGAGGHAFNVDGFRDSDSKFHVNFGWSGAADGWMELNAFTDDDGYTFNQGQQAIIGIEAPGGISATPELTVDPTSMSFSGEAGQTYTKTFTVTGVDLSGDVTVSIAGSSVYSVSPTNITKAQATAGATVTVTYSPTSAGTQSATITVASSGAASQTVSVTGTSTVNTTPTLVANPMSLSFSGEVGQTYTQTFLLSGTYLQNTVYLTCTGDGFSIDKKVQSKTAVQNGTTITVTYKPTTSGNHTGNVNISSTGAEDINVTLNGTATAAPVITVNPTSLSFNTTVGQPVTKTFTVTGADLTGNVTLACDGTGFTIDKTTINKNDATNGTTVTVTYNPTAGGNHTGTVTLNSAGAQPVTVSLNGTATSIPTLTANPTSLSFNTVAGTPVTKNFTVTGVNLTGDVNVACTGTGFTVNKTTITKNEATNGATVTVTYNPTAAGNNTGTVTLTSSGAQSVTVSLNGTATEPVRTITANPTVLNFTTIVGQPVTQTFNVSGVNLNGNLTLSLSGGNGAYSITPTTITAAQANAGNVPVTVTYNPAAAGNQSALVTISGGGAQSVTVTLVGTSTESVRTITATPTALNFTTLVGEPVSNTFNVSGENLNGDLTLTLNDANGFYSITPTTITAAQAMAGNVPVTVTYAPGAFGLQSATVTISGGGAPAVTVTLNGQADLVKYAPVMLPAIEEYINLTQFRADWTDASPEASVASYTLEVTPKAVEPEPEPEPELIASVVGTDYTSTQTYYDITLPAPWGGNNLRGANNRAIYFRQMGHQGATLEGMITYTVPEGYDNMTFTVKITTDSGSDGSGNLTVATPQTAAVGHNFSVGETYSWLVTASAGEMITITSTQSNYSPDIAQIEIYSGDATVANLRANETGDENSRLISGITDKFYTVENLAAEGTFLYRVKALYVDGTESDWSNTEEVTLFQNGHGYEVGDVDHDGKVNIGDVTALIHALLSQEVACPICADVDQDGKISIGDVTALINRLLAGDAARLKNARMAISMGR